MNAKHDWKLLEGSIPDEERPQKEVQEDEEEVMVCYIKVEGCENGYDCGGARRTPKPQFKTRRFLYFNKSLHKRGMP